MVLVFVRVAQLHVLDPCYLYVICFACTLPVRHLFCLTNPLIFCLNSLYLYLTMLILIKYLYNTSTLPVY